MKILGIRRTRGLQRVREGFFSNSALRTAAFGVGILMISSCDSAPKGPEVSGVAAEEVCAGILSADAAAALKRLSGMTRFGELPEVPSDEFSDSIERLRSGDTAELCRIYAPPDADVPSATISFSWVLPNFSGEGDRYQTGMIATVLPNAAIIAFQCEGENYPHDKVLLGNLNVRSWTREADGQMTIVNSVSRAVAEGLGCLDESGLVEGIPQPVGE